MTIHTYQWFRRTRLIAPLSGHGMRGERGLRAKRGSQGMPFAIMCSDRSATEQIEGEGPSFCRDKTRRDIPTNCCRCAPPARTKRHGIMKNTNSPKRKIHRANGARSNPSRPLPPPPTHFYRGEHTLGGSHNMLRSSCHSSLPRQPAQLSPKGVLWIFASIDLR